MSSGKIYHYSQGRSWIERIMGSLIFLVIILLFFYLSFQIYKLLYLLSPVFIILAIAIQPRVVWDYIKNIGNSFKQSMVGGALHVLVQVLGLPIVAIGLIFKAWALKKFGVIDERGGAKDEHEEFSSYEELKSDNTANTISEKKQEARAMADNYDDLFE